MVVGARSGKGTMDKPTPHPSIVANDRAAGAPEESLLLVDDNATNLQVLYQILQELGVKLMVAKDGESALRITEKVTPTLVLLDIMMPPGIDGYEVCRRLKADASTRDIPVIILSALDDPAEKVKGLELGAVDFISKPFDGSEVIARVRTHMTIRRLQLELERKNDSLEHELHVAHDLMEQARDRMEGPLLGSSGHVRGLRQSIDEHGQSDDTLLIVGPPGAGHEAVARAIHGKSARRGRAFIYVSCIGMGEEDAEALLGSGRTLMSFFRQKTPGKWGLADGGTLCIDHIEAMPQSVQKRLAKQLEGQAKERSKGTLLSDVRVIAMSISGVDDGGGTRGGAAVRDELSRLLVENQLVIPSLRERVDDIPPLVQHYV